MDLPLGQDIVESGTIKSPSFFKNRVVQTNADVLKLGAIHKKKRGRDSSQASSHPSHDEDDTWGSGFFVNPEGYDKAMIPPKVLNRLIAADAAGAFNDSNAPPPLACAYIPSSFKRRPARRDSAHPPAPADRLDCAFTVYKFFALTLDLARRCAAAGRPGVGKLLNLKAADCPGPYFMVALPDAGVGDSESGEDDTAEAASSLADTTQMPPPAPFHPPPLPPVGSYSDGGGYSGGDGGSGGSGGGLESHHRTEVMAMEAGAGFPSHDKGYPHLEGTGGVGDEGSAGVCVMCGVRYGRVGPGPAGRCSGTCQCTHAGTYSISNGGGGGGGGGGGSDDEILRAVVRSARSVRSANHLAAGRSGPGAASPAVADAYRALQRYVARLGRHLQVVPAGQGPETGPLGASAPLYAAPDLDVDASGGDSGGNGDNNEWPGGWPGAPGALDSELDWEAGIGTEDGWRGGDQGSGSGSDSWSPPLPSPPHHDF
jgi:hypothetical protein